MAIPSMDQTEKVIVVTGARRGLGRQFALTFAEAGADAAISDIEANDGLLEQTADEIRALGSRAITVQTDVTSKAQVDEMVARVLDEFGRIDVLINNAGIAHRANILEISEEEWDLMLCTHMKGTLFCTQAVSKTMIEQGSGAIVNLASIGAKMKGTIPYAIAKRGIVQMTQGFGELLGPHGIRVNAMAPGTIKTDMTRRQWEPPGALEATLDTIPLGRLGQPQDTANLALFLCSEAASFINGALITIDGGATPLPFPNMREIMENPEDAG